MKAAICFNPSCAAPGRQEERHRSCTVGIVMIGFRRLHGTVSPVRHRLGLHFQIHDQNINFERVIEFITLLHRHLRGKFILVLDRKVVRLLQEEHPDWFEVEWLPAYAPDLNPVEMVWNHSKYSDLANFIPEDVDDLHQAVTTSLGKMRTQTSLLRSFFQYAGLEL